MALQLVDSIDLASFQAGANQLAVQATKFGTAAYEAARAFVARQNADTLKIVAGACGVVFIGGVAYGIARWSRTSKVAQAAPEDEGISLNKYEASLAGDMVQRDKLGVDFEDIGGLESQIQQIEELVIFPLSHPHLFAHSAVAQQPTGVLLYGPPGTGKTLLAKAIAKTANASFLNVNVANVQSKWFGESPKLVEAVFTLARKHAPCVVFCDEIDGLLAARSDSDMQSVNTVKTKFMEMWDGLTTPAVGGAGAGASAEKTREKQTRASQQGKDGQEEADAAADANQDWVLVIGATNKPWALDPAVLRRMPRQLYIGLPDAPSRAAILRVLLRKERVAPAVHNELQRLAEALEGYSGSDLKEVVRAAALAPIREALQAERKAGRIGGAGAGAASGAAAGGAAAGGPKVTPRDIVAADLYNALQTVKPTGVAAAEYRFAQATAATAFSTPKSAHAASASPPSGPAAAAAIAAAAAAGETAAAAVSPATAPVYVPSGSIRLNTRNLTTAVEAAQAADTAASAAAAAASPAAVVAAAPAVTGAAADQENAGRSGAPRRGGLTAPAPAAAAAAVKSVSFNAVTPFAAVGVGAGPATVSGL